MQMNVMIILGAIHWYSLQPGILYIEQIMKHPMYQKTKVPLDELV